MSELIPAGQYKAVAVQQDTDTGPVWAQFGYAGQNSTPQVIVQFEIIEHPEMAGKRIYYFGFMSDKAVEYTLKNLRTCGFVGDDLSQVLTQPINNIVQLTIEHQEYDGKTSARVAFINPPFAGIKIAKPMVGADLARFAATLKAKLKGIPAVAGEKIGGKKQTSFASETGTNSVALSGEMPDLDL
jgi:hypothetical protein